MTTLQYCFKFLFNKLFSLSSNISSFSFKQREHLFDLGLYALNWFLYLLMLGLHIVFKCVFTNFFIISGLVILFVRLYWSYIQDVFGRQFPFKGQVFLLIQLHFRAFRFTGLFNIFLLCVLIFDLMLGIHE